MMLLEIILLFLFSSAHQAKELDMEKRLNLIRSGKLGDVRKEIPSLKKNYPNNSGVIFLQALLSENAEDAVALYSKIVKDYPKSLYREESLFRLYQFFSIQNNSRRAMEKQKQLLKQYPKTKLLTKLQSGKSNFYSVQIGAFNSKESARNLSEALEEKGYKSRLIEKNISDKTLYKVLFGKYSSKTDAEKAQKEIETKTNLVTIITNY